MTGAIPLVSAIESQILTESLRRVARLRPWVAMVMAEVLDTDEHELGRFAEALAPSDAALMLTMLGEVTAEAGGHA